MTALATLASGQEAPPVAVPAFRQADRVAVITIKGEIDAVTASSVKRRLGLAVAGGAQAVVLELDTPGGEVGAVLEICAAIKAAPIANTVAWIRPTAYSGGAIIALACREIVVTEASSFGDALPISIGLGGAQAATEGELRKKIVPPLLAEVVDSARSRGWDEFIVQAIVIDGVELWWVQEEGGPGPQPRRFAINEAEFRAMFPGQEPPRGSPLIVSASTVSAPVAVADGPPAPLVPPSPTAFRPASPELRDLSPGLSGALSADSAPDLDMLTAESSRPDFSAAQAGRWSLVGYLTNGSGPIVMKTREMQRFGFATAVVGDDAQLRGFLGAQTLVRLEPTWSESAVRWLSSFWVRGLLIVVFILAVFLEMTSPGVILPGVTAAVALVLLMAPAWMLGLAGWWEIVAILFGIGLLGLEILVLPGFGLFGVIGLLCLFAGLVGSFVSPGGGLFPDTPGRQSELLRGLVTVILALVTSGAGVTFLLKNVSRLPVLNRLAPPVGSLEDEEDGMLAAMDPRDNDQDRLLHRRGVAQTPLRPAGRVLIGDELVDVTSGLGFVDAGTPVRVVRVEGWRVIVEPDPAGENA